MSNLRPAQVRTTRISGPATVAPEDGTLMELDLSGGNITLTLDDTPTQFQSIAFAIIAVGDTAGTQHTLTLDGNGNLVQGTATYSFAPRETADIFYRRILFDGTQWRLSYDVPRKSFGALDWTRAASTVTQPATKQWSRDDDTTLANVTELRISEVANEGITGNTVIGQLRTGDPILIESINGTREESYTVDG